MIYRADLHIHTVLSPCGSLEMSPLNILEAAKAANINIIGIADHNSTKQCKVIADAAKDYNINVFCGAEITTKEEAHCLTFFENFEKLNEFQKWIDEAMPNIKNKPDKFGYQVWVDVDEQILGEEERLLIMALNKSVNEVEQKTHELGGIFIPAHLDRQGFSLTGQLGFIPDDLKMDGVELSLLQPIESFLEKHPRVKDLAIITSSDAHHPHQIGEKYIEVEMPDDSFNSFKEALKHPNKIKMKTR